VTIFKPSVWRMTAPGISTALLSLALASSVAFAGTSGADPSLHALTVRHVPQAVAAAQAPRMSSLSAEEHLQLALSLPTRNQSELDDLLEQLQDPASPAYHQYLSVQEYTERFGPTEADYDEVVGWAKAHGLAVTATTPNRRLVDVDGSASAINQAFHINMGWYQHPTQDRQFFAPDREPTVDLAVPLLSISGLNNYTPPSSHLRQGDLTKALAAGVNATGSGPSGQFLPSDMRAAYYGSGPLTGSGQTIGIFSFKAYKASDVSLFYSTTGTSSSVPVSNVLVNGFNGTCQSPCNGGEQVLDIVNAVGMAPGLTKVLFYEGNSATDILNKMVADNSAKILSCSWYGGDFNNPTDDPIYQEMATQGQTFVNASGDEGAYNSQAWGAPSADPYVLEVGGTDLTTNGAGGPWSAETGWADSGGGYYSGAGEATPAYQKLAGVITTTNKGSPSYRNDPDVAAEANFDNPTISDGQLETNVGGTSFAAPRWAGFLALVNQQSIANGHGPVGQINTTLYNVGLSSGYHSDFHDITSGHNTPSVGSGAGFDAVAGFDLVTGWGSPQAALVAVLAGGSTGSADFSLSASPSSVSIARGGSGTSTVTITQLNGFASSVNLSASGLPPGVSASFSPASATTSSTLTLSASTSAATGSATVTITGTSGSLTHTTTLSLSVSTSGGSSQLLGNTGFESTASWTGSTNVICATGCTGQSAHTGVGFAWLDGYGTTHTDTLSQTVSLPSGKTTAIVQYCLHINTNETTTSTAYDKLTVGLYNSAGTLLKTLATYSNLDANSSYSVHNNDVSAYIGQTVTLKFTGTEDNLNLTSFVLDDVTLTVQ